ncbi:MAG: endonuclease SmrB [Pseudomonadota bacterium]
MAKKSDKSAKTAFATLFPDATPVKHDKYIAPRTVKKKTAKFESAQREVNRQQASFEFSDGFIACFSDEQPVSFMKDERIKPTIAAIKKGLIMPDIELDLHGLTKAQAKLEISALIDHAHNHHIECVKIVHGVSGGVLKQYTPHWLVQHPLVLGFHQAPRHHGGNGALLVLLEKPL